MEGVALAKRGVGLRRERLLDAMGEFRNSDDGILLSEAFLVFLRLIGA